MFSCCTWGKIINISDLCCLTSVSFLSRAPCHWHSLHRLCLMRAVQVEPPVQAFTSFSSFPKWNWVKPRHGPSVRRCSVVDCRTHRLLELEMGFLCMCMKCVWNYQGLCVNNSPIAVCCELQWIIVALRQEAASISASLISISLTCFSIFFCYNLSFSHFSLMKW